MNVMNDTMTSVKVKVKGYGGGRGGDTNRTNKSNKQVLSKIINYKKLQSSNEKILSCNDRQINDFIEMTFEVVDEDMHK